MEMLLENRMIPSIMKPTTISKTTATLIDNILINEELQESYRSRILINNSSNHLPCYATVENILVSKKTPTKVTGRDMRPKCLERLKEKLKNENWAYDGSTSIEENFDRFHRKLT